MELILGLDIGGTHISGGLIEKVSGKIVQNSFAQFAVHSNENSQTILNEWEQGIISILDGRKADLAGIGIAMPGPFDYEKGISYIKGLGKYEGLYEMNLKKAFQEILDMPSDFPVCFQNDAVCFALGEQRYGISSDFTKVLSLTLGTGLGAAFLQNGQPVQDGTGVPDGGTLYQLPYRDGIAEDYFSARGLLAEYRKCSNEEVQNVKDIYEFAVSGNAVAYKVFSDFGKDMARFLVPWLRSFDADCLVLGGSISKASEFFIESIREEFKKNHLSVKVVVSQLNEKAAILGAVSLLEMQKTENDCRKTNQFLLPIVKYNENKEGYDIYPSFHLENDEIYAGINSLVEYIITQKAVIIDGYEGVFWKKLRDEMLEILPQNLKINFIDTNDWLLPEETIYQMVQPHLGEKDSVWGRKCDKNLSDLFGQNKIKNCRIDPDADINIVMGVGAALVQWDAPVIYLDLPKNELQYRMRAGSISNLGSSKPEDNVQMYKRFYFVDWVLLNKHKKNILNRIEIIADDQQPDIISWMYFKNLRKALQIMSKNVFRIRPWFEPGAWGGQWLKHHIKGINKEEVNYAWSFELITPENGLLFESDGLLLEISFDFLMFTHNKEILGEQFAKQFKDEFPIRFDFLDTVEGGNLSVQCHPSDEYIKDKFGENFTQDETYYILEADDDAGVYLGFQENINPKKFRDELEQSNEKNIPVNVIDYVQCHPAKKHDLFLIPNGTVHSAGAGNLVLEISATPYIFTFKMYDWLRLDLNGDPRPINIEHAFNNLNFERKGETVQKELISKPNILDSGSDWKLIHLPTHPQHFYDVYRYEFRNKVQIKTEGSCHVLMLVEGNAIIVETKNGFKQRYYYAETFVIPAAAESYTLINDGKGEVKVVKAFLK